MLQLPDISNAVMTAFLRLNIRVRSSIKVDLVLFAALVHAQNVKSKSNR